MLLTKMGFFDVDNDNRGLSLVELIIAISIGVIVSGSVAALISFALRMYQNESVNASLQYDLQTNLNMMMDEIMGSSAFVIEQNEDVALTDTDKGAYTHYAMFVNPNVMVKDEEHEDTYIRYIQGVIFVTSGGDRFNVYMDRINEKYTASSLWAFAKARAGNVVGKEKNLLGENLTQFVVEPDPSDISLDPLDPDEPTKQLYYSNPIEVRVELRFKKEGWGRDIEKHVEDVAYMRNKATESIFVRTLPDTNAFTEYKMKKKGN